MPLIIWAVVIALIAAVLDKLWGIGDPWKQLVYAGCVIVFIIGLVMLLLPGLLPFRV